MRGKYTWRKADVIGRKIAEVETVSRYDKGRAGPFTELGSITLDNGVVIFMMAINYTNEGFSENAVKVWTDTSRRRDDNGR